MCVCVYVRVCVCLPPSARSSLWSLLTPSTGWGLSPHDCAQSPGRPKPMLPSPVPLATDQGSHGLPSPRSPNPSSSQHAGKQILHGPAHHKGYDPGYRHGGRSGACPGPVPRGFLATSLATSYRLKPVAPHLLQGCGEGLPRPSWATKVHHTLGRLGGFGEPRARDQEHKPHALLRITHWITRYYGITADIPRRDNYMWPRGSSFPEAQGGRVPPQCSTGSTGTNGRHAPP